MLALVKPKAGPGLWLETCPPADRHQRRPDPRPTTGICRTDLHIYNWDAWAARTIRRPWSSGTSSSARSSRWAATCTDFHPGEVVSGEGTWSAGAAATAWPAAPPVRRHAGVGVGRAGAFAELPGAADDQRLGARPGIDETSPRSSIRSATPSTRPSASRCSAKTCWSPAPGPSASWRRRSPATPARASSSSPMSNPTGSSWPADGRDACVDPRETPLEDVQKSWACARVSTSASRCPAKPARLPRHAGQHGPRRKSPCSASPTGRSPSTGTP